MATITKAYTATIVDSAVINASNVVRAFDDIYDTINGGVDQQNFASTMTLNACNITINDTKSFISATKASLIADQISVKGWNTLHVLGGGNAGFSIFPGSIEINGAYNKLSSRLDFAISQISFNEATSGTQGVFIVAIQRGASSTLGAVELTRSDILLVDYTGTGTVDFVASKNGVYFSASHRAICTLRHVGTTATANLHDDEYLQRPSIGHRYFLTDAERSQVGFAVNTAGLNVISSVLRVFDMEDNRYYYECFGTAPTATGLARTLFSITASTVLTSTWFVLGVQAENKSAVEKYVTGQEGSILNSANIAVHVSFSGGQITYRNVLASYNSGTYNFRLKRKQDEGRRF